MTARDFCYWLQGVFEVHKVHTLHDAELEIIKNHLNLVFVHDIDTPDPTGKLQAAHDGRPKPVQTDSHHIVARC